MASWNSSRMEMAKEALRLAFEDGARGELSFDEWYRRVEKVVDTGQLLALQRLGAVYRLIEVSATHDVFPDVEKEEGGA